jgi:hypothetical protein
MRAVDSFKTIAPGTLEQVSGGFDVGGYKFDLDKAYNDGLACAGNSDVGAVANAASGLGRAYDGVRAIEGKSTGFGEFAGTAVRGTAGVWGGANSLIHQFQAQRAARQH